MKKLTTALIVASSVLVTTPSHAGFGDLVKKVTSEPSGGTYAMQDKLVKAYGKTAVSVNSAQVLLAKAFDLKDLVTQLEAEQESLKAGSVNDEKSIKANKQLTEKANKAIQEKMTSGEQLSDEGRKYYLKSFSPYVKGLVGSKKMVEESEGFLSSAKSTISSASFLEKAKLTQKLQVGTYLATKAPDLAKGLWETSKMMVTYGQKNEIDVPEDATDSIGDMF